MHSITLGFISRYSLSSLTKKSVVICSSCLLVTVLILKGDLNDASSIEFFKVAGPDYDTTVSRVSSS